MTLHMHEYFSSEDFNLRNPTKFGLHFSQFSLILYEFCKSHSNQINRKTKPTPTPTDPRAPPAEQQREQGLLCSAPAARGARARPPWGPAGQLGRAADRAQGGACACGRAGARARARAAAQRGRRRPWRPRRRRSGPGGHGARRLRSGAARRPERAGGPGARGGAVLGRVSVARNGGGDWSS